MDRRTLLAASGALAAATLASQALAQAGHHAHHDAGKYGKLQTAAADCVSKGESCLAHCLVLLGDGDKTLAECATQVNQMLALCGALQKLSAQGSSMVPALARVALDACDKCAEACKPHVDKHAECKACRESCLECSKQCKAVI